MGCTGSKDAKRYGVLTKKYAAEIESTFKKMDTDSSGFLTGDELKDVVAKYSGEGFTFDESEFFGWFDVHGANGGKPDSKLDLKEFGWYLADIAESFSKPAVAMPGIVQKFGAIVAGPEEERYGALTKGHEAAIEAAFKKIDKDSNGFLTGEELKFVVSKYSGEGRSSFDEKQFFGWFDVHGANGGKPDSKLDLKEFGWYLADIAESFTEPAVAMPGIVQKFDEIAAAGPTMLDKLDADGDGEVTFDEFTENLAEPPTLLDKLDADGDGEVTFDEFTENIADASN